MKTLISLVAVVSCVSLNVSAYAEMVDNPDYLHWSNFGVGSSSTIAGKTTVGEGDQALVVESKRSAKLISLDDEKAVIEQSLVTTMPGVNMPPMVTTVDIPAKVEAGSEQDMLNPDSKMSEGEETLEIDGKKYETKWIEYKMTEQNVSMVAKSWYADGVPGGQVKMVAEGDGQMQFKSELELSEVEVK